MIHVSVSARFTLDTVCFVAAFDHAFNKGTSWFKSFWGVYSGRYVIHIKELLGMYFLHGGSKVLDLASGFSFRDLQSANTCQPIQVKVWFNVLKNAEEAKSFVSLYHLASGFSSGGFAWLTLEGEQKFKS